MKFEIDEIEMEAKVLGALPLAKAIFEGMELRDRVDRHAPPDPRNNLTHGQVIEMLACNLLLSPTAIYKVEDWAYFSGIEALYGIDPAFLNDDRIVGALEAIHPHINTLKSEIALGAAQKYDIPLGKIHWDFTHFLFSGEYDNQEPGFVQIAYRRFSQRGPAQKNCQVCLGVSVSEKTPIPVYYDVVNGNENHKKATFQHMEKMKKYLKRDKVAFIKDAGCYSGDVVSSVVDGGFDLVCGIPMDSKIKRNFLECLSSGKTFSRLSYLSEKELLNQRVGRDVDYYWGFEMDYCVKSARRKKPYKTRLVFIKSDGKLKRDLKDREKNLKRLEKAEQNIRSKLGKPRYRTEEEVNLRVHNQTKKNPLSKYLSVSVKRISPRNLTLSWNFDWERLEKEEAVFDGVYTLITTVKKDEKSLDEIFSWYKEQAYVEIANKTLKHPVRVRPIYLHIQKRIESLMFVFFLALMGYSLIQYLVRKKAEEAWQKKLTARRILYLFHTVCIILCKIEDKIIIKPAKLQPVQEQLLAIMQLKLSFG